MNFDIDFVREQFPALTGDFVFFDNAGGSQTLKPVADRISDYLLTSNVQLGASYCVSEEAGARVSEGVQTVADFIGAKESSEVILGSSTSMLLKILSISLGETFSVGDEIIVTNCDHEANIGCWRSLEKKGMVIKEWCVNPETLELHLKDLEMLMSPRTRLVALTHASNVLGTINPIKKIASFVHERGAMICVDGVAYAPHRQVDVSDLDVDFYAFSFYKVYGPHYSVLYGKKEILETLPGINHYFIEKEIPYKFQPGNVNYELCYGLIGLKDYFCKLAQRLDNKESDIPQLKPALSLAFQHIAGYEEELCTPLLDYLNHQPDIRIIGKQEADRHIRVPTISFVKGALKSSLIPPQIDSHNVGIRFGDFYARRLIRDIGLEPQDGVIRVSMVHYNTIQEVEKLIRALDSLK